MKIKAIFNFICWIFESIFAVIVMILALATCWLWGPIMFICNQYESSVRSDWRSGEKWWFDSWNKKDSPGTTAPRGASDNG